MTANRITSADVGPPVGDEPDHWNLRHKHRRHIAEMKAGDIGARREVSAYLGGTVFLKTRRLPEEVKTITKSGEYSMKIGARVEKTEWKGRAIRTLTLEERASCPRQCENWTTCYGNNMNFTPRLVHGEDLEILLYEEMRQIGAGKCIRLHQLGDFYSLRYVEVWKRIVERFDVVAFGYTAHPASSKIGRQIAAFAATCWERFAIRFSGSYQPDTVRRAVTVKSFEEADRYGAIVCPAQLGQTANCGRCGLCWTSPRPIAFLEH